MAGGFDGFALINTVRAYDIATDTWSTLASLPQALAVPGFGIINGKLYIAGGGAAFRELNTLYVYDIATNTVDDRSKCANRSRWAGQRGVPRQALPIRRRCLRWYLPSPPPPHKSSTRLPTGGAPGRP